MGQFQPPWTNTSSTQKGVTKMLCSIHEDVGIQVHWIEPIANWFATNRTDWTTITCEVLTSEDEGSTIKQRVSLVLVVSGLQEILLPTGIGPIRQRVFQKTDGIFYLVTAYKSRIGGLQQIFAF